MNLNYNIDFHSFNWLNMNSKLDFLQNEKHVKKHW